MQVIDNLGKESTSQISIRQPKYLIPNLYNIQWRIVNMPLTVLELFDFNDLYKHRFPDEDDRAIVEKLKQLGLYDLQVQGPVRWGNGVPSDNSGFYVVSLSDNRDENNNCEEHIPVCEATIENVWLKNASKMTIDGQKANTENIKSFLSEFWLPEENILYIGQTNRKLRERVGEYYRHPIGKKSPHSGGQWLHALSICSKTFVYYVETKNHKEIEKNLLQEIEKNLLQNFDFHVQLEGNNYDEYVLPFANLNMRKEDGKMYNKNKRNRQIRMEHQRQ